MKEVEYRDPQGRLWRRYLPDGLPDSDAIHGVPGGPPPLELLGLPLDIEVRLHNELYHRRLFTQTDISRNKQSVIGALMAALRVDAERIVGLFNANGKEAQHGPSAQDSEAEPVAALRDRRPRRSGERT